MATPTQARRWAKTGATQQRILDAATEVFATRGFTAATMADVVSGSGASVGSIYHHFGGKNELFLAIFEQMATAVDRRIEEAMRQAGDAAEPRHVFELHVRAYLEAMWENRRLARVLTSGDTPPGFEVARRDRMQAAFRRWMAVLQLDASVRGQLLSRILVATMAESSLMVAACEDPDEVPAITDATIEWIGRLTE
ncbi:TetR family transcriptional regulator [Mycobacterium paraense]|uniref:TetR family transcriptional regulator n=1 Tax=Mycobacterium paraense TaxID=767916 RepID=A0A1X2AJW4_9MYCO|nr:TetR/AcrR family transcriptional regulator [Mycobacterium paraense]MCV7443581.1 TetR/AcrR family transcriptional regulator [Mycobacterium paraense]ORW32008.1 TetR family transcriptional regulator [Mycobacterium paraense]ORW39536.1 TetR family transcriptional regulator [Mycobacterium paraense]ORW47354.1 TetR family transcriptional regulator [Mycobacterium paraense]ORW51684.1 TetR family transcriptional regulator [Mycobacterium paraense]